MNEFPNEPEKNQQKVAKLQKALDILINNIEAEKLKVRVSWMDEYGGIQSIIKSSYDNLTVLEDG